MKATLVFQSHESVDLSVGMVFIPCICWVIGDKIISNDHPESPNYNKGDFQKLVKLSQFSHLKDTLKKKLILVIHPDGHGTDADIARLIQDIKMEFYEVVIINI